MEKRIFCGDETSLLGFGCMRFPKTETGEIDEPKAEAMLDRAYRNGVRYFDTAYPYHEGKSEPFVGRALAKYPRESFLLATKLPMWAVQSREDAERIFHEQLSRLGVEYVDFYLFHALRRETWENGVVGLNLIPMFEEYQRKGLIRHLGFSFHDTYEVFSDILHYRKWDFCQIQYNYMDTDRNPGDAGYKLAEELGVPLVVMEPIRGGLLANFPEEVKAMFRRVNPDRNLADWALSWVGTHRNVKTILSGMTEPEQVEDNLRIFGNFKPLTDEEMDAVEGIVKEIKARVVNPCTGCRYCLPCPFGVEIPRVFNAMNQYSIFGSNKAGYKRQAEGGREKKGGADLCRACGACLSKCPQHINIPSDIRKAISLFE